jgi:hypothetical protein
VFVVPRGRGPQERHLLRWLHDADCRVGVGAVASPVAVVVMAFIGEALMVSEVTEARCVRRQAGWAASWIPRRCLDRNSAITALTIAEFVAKGAKPGTHWWPHVLNWLDELGLTVADLPEGGAF